MFMFGVDNVKMTIILFNSNYTDWESLIMTYCLSKVKHNLI